MPVTEIGIFATPHASKYLQQLCKHFGHRREATFDSAQGRMRFPIGTAEMVADEARLTVTFTLHTPGDIEAAHRVIDKHLERFAFRETFAGMDWQSA